MLVDRSLDINISILSKFKYRFNDIQIKPSNRVFQRARQADSKNKIYCNSKALKISKISLSKNKEEVKEEEEGEKEEKEEGQDKGDIEEGGVYGMKPCPSRSQD